MPISNQRKFKEHVPVECKTSRAISQGRMYCCSHGIAVYKASSMYSLAVAISGGGSPCFKVLRMFPTSWCILLHTALD